MLFTITLLLVCLVCVGMIFTNEALFKFVKGLLALSLGLAFYAVIFILGVWLSYELFESRIFAFFGGCFAIFSWIYGWNAFQEYLLENRYRRERVAELSRAKQLNYSQQHVFPPKPVDPIERQKIELEGDHHAHSGYLWIICFVGGSALFWVSNFIPKDSILYDNRYLYILLLVSFFGVISQYRLDFKYKKELRQLTQSEPLNS